jgi:hypothetical protein
MAGYGGEVARAVGEKMAGFGETCRNALNNITHDPLWGGIAVGVLFLVVALIVVKRRAS